MKPTRKQTAAVAGGVAMGFAALVAYKAATFDYATAKAMAMTPAVSAERPDNSPYSAEYHADIARIIDIARKGRWSATDAQWIEGIIVPDWPDVPRDPNDVAQSEEYYFYSMALAVLGDRRMMQLPMPDHLLESYRETVIGMMQHPQPYIRRKGAAAAGNGYFLDDPEIGPMVQALSRDDPDPDVRRTAQLKINQAAGVESPADDCPTCPKGTP